MEIPGNIGAVGALRSAFSRTYLESDDLPARRKTTDAAESATKRKISDSNLMVEQ